MKRLLQSACILLTGMVLGWWLNDSTDRNSKESPPINSTATPTTVSSPEGNLDYECANEDGSTALFSQAGLPNTHELSQLLTQQKYEQALAYYEQALSLDERYQPLLKPVIEVYLRGCLQHCGNDAFVELVNLWLGAYYQDIPVLLILAESQRLEGSPEEAASTLQIAATYALDTGQQEDVNSSVQHLVTSTDEMLSEQQRWIELLGFYEFLEVVDLGTPAYRLRQSSLYQMLGEQQRSQELLVELRENDDGMSREWTAKLDSQLAKIAPDSAAEEPKRYDIPLTRRGQHFLVTSTINGGDRLSLLIDTGASLTTLSRSSFSKLTGTDFQYQGSRMFNTANGLTAGDVYRAASISMGQARVDNVDIAVLEYRPSAGIHGLLGMNVLRYYRFEIDQDRELLYLHPRQ